MHTTTSAHTAPHLDGTRAVFNSQWIRLPRPGNRCPLTGLSRSTLAELVRPCERNAYAPPVESRLLKRKHAARGVLLINRASLLAFIDGQPAPTRAEATEDASDRAAPAAPPADDLDAELARIEAHPELTNEGKYLLSREARARAAANQK
jgi:hypothetical protein